MSLKDLLYDVSLHKEVQYDTEFFIKDRVLYIPGTDSIVDWFFNIYDVILPTSYWHQGFYIKANLVLDYIEDNKLLYEFDECVGHSLGGAMAIIIGFLTGKTVTAYNVPKTLHRSNKAVLAWAEEKCTIRNQMYDVVGHLPLFYQHPCQPEYSYDTLGLIQTHNTF